MMFLRKAALAALLLIPASAALGAGFTDDKVIIVVDGLECKKSNFQFVAAEGTGQNKKNGKIVVSGGKKDCKKKGFAKSIDDLSDVSWNDKDRSVNFTVKGGSTYSVQIKNKSNYKMMRQALVDAV